MKAFQTPFSKNLRSNQTPWETKLWKHLRGRRFYDFKFKRQVPIGTYIVDFCCQEAKLIIELDGGGHNFPNKKSPDFNRDNFLVSKNYKILRFWNNEIDFDIAVVLEKIAKSLGITSL